MDKDGRITPLLSTPVMIKEDKEKEHNILIMNTPTSRPVGERVTTRNGGKRQLTLAAFMQRSERKRTLESVGAEQNKEPEPKSCPIDMEQDNHEIENKENDVPYTALNDSTTFNGEAEAVSVEDAGVYNPDQGEGRSRSTSVSRRKKKRGRRRFTIQKRRATVMSRANENEVEVDENSLPQHTNTNPHGKALTPISINVEVETPASTSTPTDTLMSPSSGASFRLRRKGFCSRERLAKNSPLRFRRSNRIGSGDISALQFGKRQLNSACYFLKEATGIYYPTVDEQMELYKDLCFVVEAVNIKNLPATTPIWRIRRTAGTNVFRLSLHKYNPFRHEEEERDLHVPTKTVIVFDGNEEDLFKRYYPIYVVVRIDTAAVCVVQWINVVRATKHLVRIRNTGHIVSHFVTVANLLFEQVVFGKDFIKSKIIVGSGQYDKEGRRAWDKFTLECTNRVQALTDACRMPPGFIIPFCRFPWIRFVKAEDTSIGVGQSVICGACPGRSKSASFKAIFNGEPYNQYTFQREPLKGLGTEERFLCSSCKPFLYLMWKLMHYKFHLRRIFIIHLKERIDKLEDGQLLDTQEAMNYLLKDYEWRARTFLELQVLFAEADVELQRLEDAKRRYTTTKTAMKKSATMKTTSQE